jgi:hypothetical protein
VAIQSLRKAGFLSESQSEVLVIDPTEIATLNPALFHDKMCHNKACFRFFTKSEQLALTQATESWNYRPIEEDVLT